MGSKLNRLRTVGLRQIITIFFSSSCILNITPLTTVHRFEAQAASADVESGATGELAILLSGFKEKLNLGDRPDRPIGDTGLGSKQRGKIPKVSDLNVRQQRAKYITYK